MTFTLQNADGYACKYWFYTNADEKEGIKYCHKQCIFGDDSMEKAAGEARHHFLLSNYTVVCEFV